MVLRIMLAWWEICFWCTVYGFSFGCSAYIWVPFATLFLSCRSLFVLCKDWVIINFSVKKMNSSQCTKCRNADYWIVCRLSYGVTALFGLMMACAGCGTAVYVNAQKMSSQSHLRSLSAFRWMILFVKKENLRQLLTVLWIVKLSQDGQK